MQDDSLPQELKLYKRSVDKAVLLLPRSLSIVLQQDTAFSLQVGATVAFMEPTAACGGPFELQVATNWSAQEPAGDAQVWGAPPAGGLPLEYASIVDIFGSSSCSLQPYNYAVPASCSSSSSGGQQQQLVEYNYYAAAAQHDDGCPRIEKSTEVDYRLFQKTNYKFQDDADLMKTKMHRYPPIIRDIDGWCAVPRVVAIGPYHHRREHLQKAETVKHVAAYHCMEAYNSVNKKSVLGREVPEEVYQVVVSAAENIKLGENQWVTSACNLYDKDVMAGICYNEDFLPMMFYDACFLVMYMLKMSCAHKVDRALVEFFESSGEDIAHDIMLLENQIPWPVVEAVMNKCTPDPLETKKKFIVWWTHEYCLQGRILVDPPEADLDHPSYEQAPHLLGLLRFHIVGKGGSSSKLSESDRKKIKSISISAGAIELAEMGVFLTANGTGDLPDMRLVDNCIYANLSMAPLSLDDQRASMLVNMAALELCTTPDFLDEDEAEPEDSAVCSYLLLLCMLMHREEDVHQLRAKGILKGAGLSNKRALDFFNSLGSLRTGRCYADVMVQIERYRVTRCPGWLWLYAFVYNNWKYIFGFASAAAGFIGVIKTLIDLKRGK